MLGIIILCVLILLSGSAIGVLTMRLFFHRKNTIDKAELWIDHSGLYDKKKAIKNSETTDAILYQYKYGDDIKIVTVPNDYGFKFHKGKRLIWLDFDENGGILAQKPPTAIKDIQKDEEGNVIENVVNFQYFSDLIKRLTISKIGSDAVNRMGRKSGGMNIIIFIIALIIGAVAMWFYTGYIQETPETQQQQQQESGSATFK